MANAVKTALLADLATVTTANGYNTTIKTVKEKVTWLKDAESSDCPLISVFLTNAPSEEFDEANNTIALIYTAMPIVKLNDGEDVEDALLGIYLDLVTLFNNQTCQTNLLDVVDSVEVIDFFPDVTGNDGYALIPIKITYKL